MFRRKNYSRRNGIKKEAKNPVQIIDSTNSLQINLKVDTHFRGQILGFRG